MRHVSQRKVMLVLGLLGLFSFLSGCKKTVSNAPPAPPPAAPAARPTVTLNVSPASVTAGQSVTLSWQSTDATDLDIQPSVGKVAPQGVDSGDGEPVDDLYDHSGGAGRKRDGNCARDGGRGSHHRDRATGRTGKRQRALRAKCAGCIFRSRQIGFERRSAGGADEGCRVSPGPIPQVRVSIEGHCDERGSTEYNLGLGQRRAEAAKNFLISLGIASARMDTVSWGKERPFCSEHDESCWHQNRPRAFRHGAIDSGKALRSGLASDGQATRASPIAVEIFSARRESFAHTMVRARNCIHVFRRPGRGDSRAAAGGRSFQGDHPAAAAGLATAAGAAGPAHGDRHEWRDAEDARPAIARFDEPAQRSNGRAAEDRAGGAGEYRHAHGRDDAAIARRG